MSFNGTFTLGKTSFTQEWTEPNSKRASVRSKGGNELQQIRDQLKAYSTRSGERSPDPKIFADQAVFMIDRALVEMAKIGETQKEIKQKVPTLFTKRSTEAFVGLKKTSSNIPTATLTRKLSMQFEKVGLANTSREPRNRARVYSSSTIFRDPRISPKSSFLEKVNFQVEELGLHQTDRSIIGENLTHLALKNPVSYMIGTKEKGVKLFEDSAQIYSGMLPVYKAWLTDMIYVLPLDCYFMNHDHKLYRKDIDNKPPYLFMNVRCGNRVGASFRYSELHERMVVNKDNRNISVINLEKKRVEIEVLKSLGGDINDFRVFSENEDQVVALTKDGYVLLYQLDFGKKTGSVVSQTKLDLIEERYENGKSISICSKNKNLLVEIGQYWSSFICSRMVVLQLDSQKLVKKAVIDQYSQKIGSKYALECYGYAGRHALWIGLSWNHNGMAQVYDYDTQTAELKELVDKRIGLEERDPIKILKLANQFYYTGYRGKVMQLSLSV